MRWNGSEMLSFWIWFLFEIRFHLVHSEPNKRICFRVYQKLTLLIPVCWLETWTVAASEAIVMADIWSSWWSGAVASPLDSLLLLTVAFGLLPEDMVAVFIWNSGQDHSHLLGRMWFDGWMEEFVHDDLYLSNHIMWFTFRSIATHPLQIFMPLNR